MSVICLDAWLARAEAPRGCTRRSQRRNRRRTGPRGQRGIGRGVDNLLSRAVAAAHPGPGVEDMVALYRGRERNRSSRCRQRWCGARSSRRFPARRRIFLVLQGDLAIVRRGERRSRRVPDRAGTEGRCPLTKMVPKQRCHTRQSRICQQIGADSPLQASSSEAQASSLAAPPACARPDPTAGKRPHCPYSSGPERRAGAMAGMDCRVAG
ncbi:hypothetical protein ShzoTeo12_53690 (plasmid) [Shinella zoogloeoides]|nr:hypothetical protein ShzoTeo12_53690 [Shinella zoogloeoides]